MAHEGQPPAKKEKTWIEKQRENKQKQKDYQQTLVSLGREAFTRWRQLKALKGFKTDQMVATFLLDSYYKHAATPTPTQAARPDVSSIHSVSHSNGADVVGVKRIRTAEPTAAEEPVPLSTAFMGQLGLSMMGGKTSQLTEDAEKENAWKGEVKSYPFAVVELTMDSDCFDEAQSCQEDCGAGEEKVEDGKEAEKEGEGVEDNNIVIEEIKVESMEESDTEEEGREEEEEEWEMENEEESEELEEDPGEEWKEKETVEVKKVRKVRKLRKRLTDDDNKLREKRKSLMRNRRRVETLCTNCGRIYNTKTHSCDPTQKFQCPDCGVFLQTELNLRVHRRGLCHRRCLQCKFCLKFFETRQDEITHEMSHFGEMAYECPQCPERFSDWLKRGRHLKEQHPHRSRCQTCYKEFPDKTKLWRHEMSHSTDKPYKCEVCDRGFSQASQLKSHMRVHTGEKPFQCQLCPNRFNHNISLKTHMRRCHQDESHEQDYHSPGSEPS